MLPYLLFFSPKKICRNGIFCDTGKLYVHPVHPIPVQPLCPREPAQVAPKHDDSGLKVEGLETSKGFCVARPLSSSPGAGASVPSLVSRMLVGEKSSWGRCSLSVVLLEVKT